MPAAIPRVRVQELNTFVLATLDDPANRDPEDLVSRVHPVFKRMENGDVKTIERRPGGQGPREEVMYAAPDRSVEASLSDGIVDKEHTPIEGYTDAKFDWVMRIDTLTIPEPQYRNNQGPNQIADIVVRKKRQLDSSYKSALVNYLWNGGAHGSDVFWGLNEIVRFDPNTAPAKGNVGRLDHTNPLLPHWKNNAINYNKAYLTINTGAEATNMLTDTDGLLDLWIQCSDNADGDSQEGQPDLMPCNQTFLRYMTDLADRKLVFVNKDEDFNLGVEGFWYRSGVVFWDRNVPNDPNNATYGVCMMLNSRSFSFIFTEGIERSWEDMYKLQTKTAYAWDRYTQLSMSVRHPAKNGIFFGVKAKTIA